MLQYQQGYQQGYPPQQQYGTFMFSCSFIHSFNSRLWAHAYNKIKQYKQVNEKNAQERRTQTLRAGCSKAEPKIFASAQTPFPGAQDGQNLISSRRTPLLPTNPVWWGLMHAVSSYRGNRPTHKQTNTPTNTHTNTQTGPITIHCAAAS